LPETRIGIFPGGGGTQRLPRIIGEAKALEMILWGLTVTGPRALEMGIVHEAVDDPLSRALEIGAELSS
jgi:enoyl-CoA hydratase/carnithine racemase